MTPVLGHVGGLPIEELVPMLVIASSTGLSVLTLIAARLWRPRSRREIAVLRDGDSNGG